MAVEEQRLLRLMAVSATSRARLVEAHEQLCLSGQVSKRCDPGPGSRVVRLENDQGVVLARLALVGRFTLEDPFPPAKGSNSSHTQRTLVLKRPTPGLDGPAAPLTESNCICQPQPVVQYGGHAGGTSCGPESGWCCSPQGDRKLLQAEPRGLFSVDSSKFNDLDGLGTTTNEAVLRQQAFDRMLFANGGLSPQLAEVPASTVAPLRQTMANHLHLQPAERRTCTTVGPCMGRNWDYCSAAMGDNRAVLALI